MPPLASAPADRSRWRVGLLTSGGVHLVTQAPFDMTDDAGDVSFRVVPHDVDPADLTITHDSYDHSAAERDVNCVLPLGPLAAAAAAGRVQAAPRHVSFMGRITGPRLAALARDLAPAVADLFVTDGVNVVVASPG